MTTLLPFQPDAMTPAQLAAVSYLAHYSGHTQLRRWFASCETHVLAGSTLFVHPRPRRFGSRTTEKHFADTAACTSSARATSPPPCPSPPAMGLPETGRSTSCPSVRSPRHASSTRSTGTARCLPNGGPHRDGRGIPRHISPHSLRHAAITNALDAGVPLRDAQILARHADPRTTEHYDRARGNLDRHGVRFLTAYVAGV